MKNLLKNLAVILGTGVLTALVASVLLAPEITIAEDDLLLSMTVGPPGSLVLGDLTLTVAAGEKVQEPGAKPNLVLTAVSTSKKTEKVGVDVELTSMRAPDFTSRAMPMPVPVWTKRIEVEVEPGKSRTIQVATSFETKADTIVGVNLISGKKRVRVAGFGVKKPEAAQTYSIEKKNP